MNRFPMRVETPTGEIHRPVRVLFDGTTTHVYAWQNGAGVEVLALTGPPERSGWGVWSIDTDEGRFLAYDDGGCGCSHPLKSWRPMVPVRVARA